jgi:hypothetical protein
MKQHERWNEFRAAVAVVAPDELDVWLGLYVARLPGGAPDGKDFVAMALETPKVQKAGSVAEAAAQVFDHHVHDLIGSHETERGARRLARAYGRRWKAQKLAGLKAKPCPCGTIGTETPAPAMH